MRIRIHQLDLPPGYTPEQLLKAAAKTLRVHPSTLGKLEVLRRSIDARGRNPRLTVSVETCLQGKPARCARPIEIVQETPPLPSIRRIETYAGPRPLVVGAGPAGLMAAWTLAEAGLRPILAERGQNAEHRAGHVAAFWAQGELNPESNALFGEGGAGLFSDGKLTSRSKDRTRLRRFLQRLTDSGAPASILHDAEPHLGSDVLLELVPTLRQRIQDLGGTVGFGACLEDLEIVDGALRGAVVSGATIRTDHCVLATGHSARDVYRMLARHRVALAPKPFAVGLRLEIPQHRIDTAQWGGPCAALGKASFRLTRREDGPVRACYTFCMCPGGQVIACASSAGALTTNGMSLSQRDQPFGNAAFLVPVDRRDFPAAAGDPLAGMAFQQQIERAAFVAGGSDFGLPAQCAPDFLAGTPSTDLPPLRSCLRSKPTDLHAILPDAIAQTLRQAIPAMLRRLRAARLEEAVLYGAETRSSSPVRLLRDDDGQSTGLPGLYPCGEGAGTAGGIVSAGLDGMRTADLIVAAESAH